MSDQNSMCFENIELCQWLNLHEEPLLHKIHTKESDFFRILLSLSCRVCFFLFYFQHFGKWKQLI